MTTAEREELLHAVVELSNLHPNWRFGQLVLNASVWAREASSVELWDLEDGALLGAIRTHLEQHRHDAASSDSGETADSA